LCYNMLEHLSTRNQPNTKIWFIQICFWVLYLKCGISSWIFHFQFCRLLKYFFKEFMSVCKAIHLKAVILYTSWYVQWRGLIFAWGLCEWWHYLLFVHISILNSGLERGIAGSEYIMWLCVDAKEIAVAQHCLIM